MPTVTCLKVYQETQFDWMKQKSIMLGHVFNEGNDSK